MQVDTETDEVRVLKYLAVHDVGKPLNPMSLEGQVHGGIHMGMGYALSEGIVLNDDGTVKGTRIRDAHLFRAAEMPDIHDLTDVLRVLTSMIFRPERMTVSYTGSAGETEALKDDVCHFKEQLVRELSDIRKMPEGFEESASDLESALRPDDREGFGCASKVQYVAVTGNFRDSKLDYSGAMNGFVPIS